jgi:hypothetical protein
MLGVGARLQRGIHGFDLLGNTCPLNPPVSLNSFHFRSLYLLYPAQKRFYLGSGLGMLNEPESVRISGSFECALGYQWKSQIFLEASAIVPFVQSDVVAPIWPGVTLGVGF